MAQKRFGVGLMATILKFKMAADRGRFLSGTRPEMIQYQKKYLCAKFGAFIPICTIFPLSAGLLWVRVLTYVRQNHDVISRHLSSDKFVTFQTNMILLICFDMWTFSACKCHDYLKKI
jgi:hypothetical protein